MLIMVTGRLVRPYGTGDTALPQSGKIRCTPVAHGVHNGAFRGVEPVAMTITDGEAVPVELTPGYWEIVVYPEHGSSWTPWTVLLEPGMTEPVDLVNLAPVAEIDGHLLARGVGIAGIDDDDHDGVATVTYTDGTVSSLPLPQGPPGSPADLTAVTARLDALAYETGWIDIMHLSPDGTLGEGGVSRMKRVADTVYLLGWGPSGDLLKTLRMSGNQILIDNLPEGFRAAGYSPTRGTISHGYGAQQGFLGTLTGIGQMRIYLGPVSGNFSGYLNWSAEYETSDARPEPG